MTRRPGLDLLRAIAIVWVMLFHGYLAGWTGGGVLRWSGWMGVDLFFALSGFLIGAQVFTPLAHGLRVDFVDFYLRRGFRTLPAYLVVLAAYLAWPSLREVPGMMPAWQFLTYTLNLFIDPTRVAFSHAWSLCVEEQFYLLFPALAVLLAARGSWRRGWIVLGVLVLGGMCLRAGLWLHVIAPLQRQGVDVNGAYLRFLYYPTYARLDDLLAGIALAALRSRGTRAWDWLGRHADAMAVAGVSLTALCMFGFDGRREGFAANVFGYPVLALAMAALVAAAASPRGALSRLQVPGAAWIARISYSLYLTHVMVYGLGHGRFAHAFDGHGTWTALLYALAVLGAGAGLHYTVERPFLRWREPVRRRWAARQRRMSPARPGYAAPDTDNPSTLIGIHPS